MQTLPVLLAMSLAITAISVVAARDDAPATATPPAPATPAPAPTPPAPIAPELTPPTEPSLIGRRVLVVMRDAREFRGTLTERSATHITLEIAGIPARFNAADIDRIRAQQSPAERFAEIRATIKSDDAGSLLPLIQWVIDQGELDLGIGELEALSQRVPDNQAVAIALTRARQLRELRATPANISPATTPGTTAADPDATDAPEAFSQAIPLLTPEQQALLKVFEADLSRPLNLVIPTDVMLDLFERYAGNPLVPATKEARDAFLRRPQSQWLDLIFRLKAREVYPKVQINGLPEPLRDFRDRVHSAFVLNSCATNVCHGGRDAGRLALMNRRRNSEATVLTNFHILENFRLADGRPLIDYDNPEASPLLQLALPRNVSQFRHPVVIRSASGQDLFKPAFNATTDRGFQDAVAWIRSMYMPRPKYDLGYVPLRPLVPAPTDPTSQPER